MGKYITKCPKCGENNFAIGEYINHNASIVEETGRLTAFSKYYDEIDLIRCQNCNKEFESDNFNGFSFQY